MSTFKFAFNEREYELNTEKLDYFLNDEEQPLVVETEDILTLMNEADEVVFEQQYYDEPCGVCLNGKKEKTKYFKFLEYHFFIFAKEQKFVVSSISKDRDMSFNRMEKQGLVDGSYIVSIMVCENCGSYAIEIEQCEV